MARITQSELAARLVVEACLPAITETVRGELPIEPVLLTDSEAARFGLAEGGTTLLYPLGDSGVFFDMAVSRMMVWFSGGDADKALPTLEAMLKKKYPQATLGGEGPHPENSSLRVRNYDVKLGNGRVATLEISYPVKGAHPPRFAVQVIAMALKN